MVQLFSISFEISLASLWIETNGKLLQQRYYSYISEFNFLHLFLEFDVHEYIDALIVVSKVVMSNVHCGHTTSTVGHLVAPLVHLYKRKKMKPLLDPLVCLCRRKNKASGWLLEIST